MARSLLSYFQEKIKQNADSLRKVLALAVQCGIPVPAMANALAYLDEFRSENVGANLIQAQRDFFGAHSFQRRDREGIFHHIWNE